ncbi:hypothetical protein [Neobacillus mesonae]|uniref:hypothetical protein n=1 Tax=Neobacillus mesonae TaxID=1193713 RepID=UPI002041CD30|nr:hypothetical protein [Neobacillus mesonae]MCM3568622.1 hypothetical protein [Neobacillus mesonae]
MIERSMKKGWIARGGGKNGGTVNARGLDCPRRRKKWWNGQWRGAGLPEEEEKMVERSMERSWMAREGGKNGGTVNEEGLDGPRGRKKWWNGQ